MGRRPMTHDQRAKMRARILEAARERFLEEGLDGLSMRGIASKVGVSSMTLYLYYESRQDIIRHISVEAFKQLNVEIEKAAKSGKPGEKIRQVLDAYIKWALANHRFYGAMYNYVADDDADVPNEPLLNGIENRNGNADVNYTANTLKGAFTAAATLACAFFGRQALLAAATTAATASLFSFLPPRRHRLPNFSLDFSGVTDCISSTATIWISSIYLSNDSKLSSSFASLANSFTFVFLTLS